jgi:hypothetical protein
MRTVFTEAFTLALKQKGYGSIGELANICLVSRSTIVHWRDGVCLPLFIRWEEIEEYFGWEPGTIDYLTSQKKHPL